MSRDNILKSTLALAYICVIIGLVGKILHFPQSEILLIIALVAAVIYSGIALAEIWPSDQIETTEKWMWTTGFIFLSGIAGLLYVFYARKRIIRSTPSNAIS